MDKPISVGDLVMVIRHTKYANLCACPSTAIGHIFRVQDISKTPSHCGRCMKPYPAEWCAWDGGVVYELTRLKRIPPLSELEGERTQEGIREPA